MDRPLKDLSEEEAVDLMARYMNSNPLIEGLVANRIRILQDTGDVGGLPLNPSTAASGSSRSTGSSFTSFLTDSLGIFYSGINNFTHKMVFVVNMSLEMGRGKQCAQVAHAALGLYLKIQNERTAKNITKLDAWLSEGQKKIVLKGTNLQQLKSIQEEAQKAGLPNLIISDAGCTQIAPGSKTVLAIFGSCSEVDMVTGALKLL